MVHSRKVTGTISTMPAGLLWGGLASMIVTAAGSALAAWLILRGTIPADSAGYASLVILLTGAVLGACISWHRIRHRRMLVCLLSGGVYFLCLVCTTALLFGGQYEGVGVTALAVLGSSLCTGLAGRSGRQGRGKVRFRKYKKR